MVGRAALALIATACLALAAPLAASSADAPALLGASRDPAAAPAGAYKVDPSHTSVIARVSHRGVSISTLRFGGVEGALDWNPTQPDGSRLTVTIDTGSLSTPVKFLLSPNSEGFLDSAKFPTATFVATDIRRTGPSRGQIAGNLRLRGVTRPVAINAELVGAKLNAGVPTIGFTGELDIKRSDFGSTFLSDAVGDDIRLIIDVEFRKI